MWAPQKEDQSRLKLMNLTSLKLKQDRGACVMGPLLGVEVFIRIGALVNDKNTFKWALISKWTRDGINRIMTLFVNHLLKLYNNSSS